MNKDKILEILAETLEKDFDEIRSLDESVRLDEIGFESIRFVTFIVNIEEEFGIEVNDSDLPVKNFETLGELFQMLGKYFTVPYAPKKVLILDCDNVLWDSISGEEEITLNAEIVRFQTELIRLYERGVLLCLCSKNERRNVEAAFNMPTMLLKWEHIACAEINLADKARNIRKIAGELNLSTDSFVFVDDSDYELGLVGTLIAGIDTIKADHADARFIDTVRSFFDGTQHQDMNRTKLYKEQKERQKEQLRFETVEEYNSSLETRYTCGFATPHHVDRIAELSQRTNQFNLSCSRYTADEVTRMMDSGDCSMLTLSVTDKYGDMGVVGAAAIRSAGAYAVIEGFMLSCRVFGRGFEFVLLEKIKDMAFGKELRGVYAPSEKNKRYAGFYSENGVRLYE